MKLHLIYTPWQKLEGQTKFNLPPHGPVAMAAALPEHVEVMFTNENIDKLRYRDDVDLVGFSIMLTAHVKRGRSIADKYRMRGKKVILGGISTMLHAVEKEMRDGTFRTRRDDLATQTFGKIIER